MPDVIFEINRDLSVSMRDQNSWIRVEPCRCLAR